VACMCGMLSKPTACRCFISTMQSYRVQRCIDAEEELLVNYAGAAGMLSTVSQSLGPWLVNVFCMRLTRGSFA
jgi:hypothetical protein